MTDNPTPQPTDDLLMVWMSLGGTADAFIEWMAEPRRTHADAAAQLSAATRGHWPLLFHDTNPPAGQLLDLYLQVTPDD